MVTMTNPDAIVMRHRLEDMEQKELLKRAAPLAASLDYGINYFEPKPYRDLAYFFLEGAKVDDALEAGTFTVERFYKIVRTREGSMMTVSELARVTGVPQKTLWRWVTNSDIPYRSIGNKKLYNIKDIESLLVTNRSGT